ncbi:MAG: diguanylate cyclase [Acidovorax sp.]
MPRAPDAPALLQLLAMQQDSPVLVALFDDTDRLRYGNAAMRSAYGLGADESPRWEEFMRRCYATGVGALIETSDIDAWIASAQARRGKQPYRAFETDLCDGRWLWVTETVRADGWLLLVATDITALRAGDRTLRQQRDRALRAAQTDLLTRISNREHILRQLDDHLAVLRASGQPCGLVLLDLDNFKAINDRFGHVAGDRVLQDFATAVQQSLRRGDGFGRIGGEEFMLLLPGLAERAVQALAERLLRTVAARRPLADEPGFSYSGSAGMYMLQPHDDARTACIQADRALYAAKAAGRDRAVWASGQG